MRSYVFIKDESYSSTLFNNLTEYLSKDDDFSTPLIGQAPYKIKLMPLDEAYNLIDRHPLMLSPKTNLENPFNQECDKVALVSFGGSIVRPSIATLMRMADNNHIGMMVSESTSNNEADLLLSSYYTTASDLREKKTPHYCYMMMTKIKDTGVYYLVLNPTLVHAASHIELEGNCWIEQVKGIKDTIKDSIFTMRTHPGTCAGHILSGGLVTIEVLADSMIQPEDRVDFLNQLTFEITTTEGACYTSAEEVMSVAHKGTVPLTIEVKNELLGDFISDKEKLRWEYILGV